MNRLHHAISLANGKPFLGAAVYFYDPIFLEICAHLGYKAIWIEMEHGHITFAEAADLCRMAAGTGMLTMIRIPDARRENVLKAAECGPDIIDVPMIERPEQMHELRKYARFAPEGSRGFFSVSRAVNYGIPNQRALVRRRQATPAQHRSLPDGADRIRRSHAPHRRTRRRPRHRPLHRPRRSRRQPRTPRADRPSQGPRRRRTDRQDSSPPREQSVATACGAADYIHWTRLGIDLLFCTNDIVCLKTGAQQALAAAADAIAQAEEESDILTHEKLG
jgi:hypothetical protein